jgi:signal transduction histidine kinase/quercetin dioxygenase-like cupin family protein
MPSNDADDEGRFVLSSCRGASGRGVTKKSFASPDEARSFDKGFVEVVTLGDASVARFSFAPGWSWSAHVKPLAGTEACQARHLGVVVSGQVHVSHLDGTEIDLQPGDAYLIEPGHSGYVVGDEPVVQYELEPATTKTYALPLEARLEAMNQLSRALLAEGELDSPLRVVAGQARHLVGARCAAIALAHGRGELTIAVCDGPGHDKLEGSVFSAEGSITAKVMQWGTTEVVENLSEGEGAFSELAASVELGAAVVAPLWARSETIGALIVANRREEQAFGEKDAELLRSFASQVSLAVEYGRAHEQLERLVVLEERARIARDLHDVVVQRLFGIGLGLQRLFGERYGPGEAYEVLREAIEGIDATIADIRTTIFALEPERDRSGVRAKVLKVAYDAQGALGFRPTVRFSGAIDTCATGELGHHVVAVVREALSNVARHARASKVVVEVEASTELLVRVRDNGIGIGARLPRKSGLENLRARAEKLGGTFSIAAKGPLGTTLEWRVPLL